MTADAIVVLCAVPTDFDAESLASELVEQSIAACVQIGACVTSIYKWQGALEKSQEKLLIIKSRGERFDAIEAAIKARHPYSVPEVIVLPVLAGHAPYLEWLAAATAS